MKYTYTYKTSDGVRHQAVLSASSRAEVFTTLRARGIRAIKVVAADGSKDNGEIRGVRKRVVAAATLLAALAGMCAVLLVTRVREGLSTETEPPRVETYQPGMDKKMESLAAAAKGILADHDYRMSACDTQALTDYVAISVATNTIAYKLVAQRGLREINTTRQRVRELFRTLYEIFPADCVNERTAAQRLYVETMDIIDLAETRLVRDEKAFDLLFDNRGKWTVQNGGVVFSDLTLSAEFDYLRRSVDSAASRWSRDFENQ